jgi:hypothetical protein
MKITRGFALKQEDATGKHEGSPCSFREDNPRLICSAPAVLMWADDYEAMVKEVEEWRAFKEKNKGRWEGAAAAIKRQGMTPVTNDAEITAISGRRFESDIDEGD